MLGKQKENNDNLIHKNMIVSRSKSLQVNSKKKLTKVEINELFQSKINKIVKDMVTR